MFTLSFYKPDHAGLLNKMPSGGFEYPTLEKARDAAQRALKEHQDIEVVHIDKPGQSHAVEVIRRIDRSLH